LVKGYRDGLLTARRRAKVQELLQVTASHQPPGRLARARRFVAGKDAEKQNSALAEKVVPSQQRNTTGTPYVNQRAVQKKLSRKESTSLAYTKANELLLLTRVKQKIHRSTEDVKSFKKTKANTRPA